jgi:hypothetical protein
MPINTRIIARLIFATSEQILIFHPALKAQIYPYSNPIIKKPNKKLVQLIYLNSESVSFEKFLFKNNNKIVNIVATAYVILSDANGFIFLGVDLVQIL